MSRQDVIDHLSAERMAPFLRETDGNRKKALELYYWHSELVAATHVVLGYTEVILRNAIDQRLQEWNRAHTGNDSWLLEPPATHIRAIFKDDKRKAACDLAKIDAETRTAQHPRCGEEMTHADVLSKIMFGTWKAFLPNHSPTTSNNSKRNQSRITLWHETLHGAFPNIDDPLGEKTYWRVSHLRDLRNRVAHMDALLNIDMRYRLKEAFALIHAIDTSSAQWIAGKNPVPTVLKRRPK